MLLPAGGEADWARKGEPVLIRELWHSRCKLFHGIRERASGRCVHFRSVKEIVKKNPKPRARRGANLLC